MSATRNWEKQVLEQMESLSEEDSSKVFIRGFVDTVELDYANSGKPIYKMMVEVQRKSGVIDRVPIKAPEQLDDVDVPFIEGETIEIEGQLRTRNYFDEKGRHLEVYVFARKIRIVENTGEDINVVYLDGHICKETNYRLTSLGKEITDILLAVNRDHGDSAYIPLITWGGIAQRTANYSVGDRLQIYGRLQSRKYRKITENGIVEKEAYEVSVNHIEH